MYLCQKLIRFIHKKKCKNWTDSAIHYKTCSTQRKHMHTALFRRAHKKQKKTRRAAISLRIQTHKFHARAIRVIDFKWWHFGLLTYHFVSRCCLSCSLFFFAFNLISAIWKRSVFNHSCLCLPPLVGIFKAGWSVVHKTIECGFLAQIANENSHENCMPSRPTQPPNGKLLVFRVRSVTQCCADAGTYGLSVVLERIVWLITRIRTLWNLFTLFFVFFFLFFSLMFYRLIQSN